MFGGSEVTYQAWNGIDAQTLADDRTFNPSGIYTDDDGNTQFYDREVDDYKQDHYQLHWSQRYNNNWSTNIGLNYTYGRGFFEQFREDDDFSTYGFEPLTVNGEAVNTTDLVRRRWLDNDFYVFNASANYKDTSVDLVFGGSFSHYDGDHFGEVIWAEFASQSEIRDRYYEGNGKKNDISVFSKANYRLNDRIQLYGDLQVRNVNYETSGIASNLATFTVDENYTFFNPKAGITYELNTQNDLYFSYARANREPTRDDFENNANVKPEQLNDFELGLRHKKGNFSFNVNGYVMLYNEQLVLTGNIDGVGNPIRTNSGESYRAGIELEAIIPVTPHITLQPNAAFSANRNRETITSLNGELINLGETDIAFSPNIVAANAIVYQPIKNLQMSLLSKFVGEQFMSNTENEDSKLDSFFVNDFNITYTLETTGIFKSIVFTGLVNNILNEKYVANGYFGSFDFDDNTSPTGVTTGFFSGFYPQATTNFLAGVTLNF
jgi:iron complex outermembrane receptor protein